MKKVRFYLISQLKQDEKEDILLIGGVLTRGPRTKTAQLLRSLSGWRRYYTELTSLSEMQKGHMERTENMLGYNI